MVGEAKASRGCGPTLRRHQKGRRRDPDGHPRAEANPLPRLRPSLKGTQGGGGERGPVDRRATCTTLGAWATIEQEALIRPVADRLFSGASDDKTAALFFIATTTVIWAAIPCSRGRGWAIGSMPLASAVLSSGYGLCTKGPSQGGGSLRVFRAFISTSGDP